MHGHGADDSENAAAAERNARDLALLARIRAGDVAAFEALVRAYADLLADVSYGVVKSEAGSQDIVQDLFFRIWDMRERLDIRGSVAAYLIRGVRNQALKTVRHERSQARIAGELESEYLVRDMYVTNDGEQGVIEDLRAPDIVHAIAMLQPRLREVLLLHLDHGLKAPEIAEALGILPATVHSLIYRATRQLAAMLRSGETGAS